jgi:nucleoside-diphosphate-sugar epimerase
MGEKTALITGATGFIGSAIMNRCLNDGYRVRLLVRKDSPRRGSLKNLKGVELVTGDIRDYESVEKATAGADYVFHSAAVVTDWAPRRDFDEINVAGTGHVCRAALQAKVKRLVYVSTCDVFGIREDRVLTEASGYHPMNEPYPDTKIQASNLAWEYHRQGLPVTMVYPCWVYGPGDRTFMPILADAVATRQMIYFRENAILWMSYIDNVVDLCMHIATHPAAPGEGFLVHDDASLTLEQMCDIIAETLGCPRIKRRVRYPVAYLAGWVVQRIAKMLGKKKRPLVTTYSVKLMGSRLRFSTEKAKRLLKWVPPVPFDMALSRTLDWLKAQDMSSLKEK